MQDSLNFEIEEFLRITVEAQQSLLSLFRNMRQTKDAARYGTDFQRNT